jgi:hypothetical protein
MIKIHGKYLRDQVSLISRMLGAINQTQAVAIIIHSFGGLIEISSSLLTIYASAQIAALLALFVASGNSGNIWFWLWVDVAAATGIILGFAIMQFAQRILILHLCKMVYHAISSSTLSHRHA